MALLIHIAGDSDLGIAVGGFDSCERRRIQVGRLNELEELSDPEQIARRLLEMNYDVAVEEKRRGVDVNPKQHRSTPLKNTLQGLEELEKTGPLQVLIIGTADGEGGTECIARALARQLKELRSLVRERCSIELGEVTPLVFRSLAEKDWLVMMEEAMQGSAAEGEVILPIAGGSTAIVLGVAGAAIASGRDLSMLLAKRQQTQHYPRKSQQAQLYPLKISADPIRGWLLGLGLPTLLGDEYQDDGQVRQAADNVKRAFAEKVTVDQRADALGQLLLMDVARGDLAAGMSIRAWHDAEMKRPNDQGGSKCLMSAALKEAGKSATHDFAALMDGEAAETTRQKVRAAVGESAVPDFLSWPNEHVCLICSVGTNRQQDDRGDFASNLMKMAPPEEIRLACSVAGEFRLHTVLLASQDSADHAHNLKEELETLSASNSRESSWAQPSAEVINYGTSAGGRETVEELTTLINNVSGEVRKSLDDRCPRPRAILVATLGEKEAVLAALSAAQNYGAQWGIPVFLVSTVKRNEEEFQFHQFGLHQDAREALLRAARYCMERLDLLSTYRLLTLGDQKMREHAEAAKSLAEDLEEAVNAKQIDEHAARIVDVYRVIAGFCQSSSDELLRARLATIAGELIFRGHRQDEPVILRRKKGDKSAVKTLKSATREQLLQIIYKVRTETALNHGEFTVDQALEDVLRKRISSTSLPTTTTYSDLLEAAAGKIEEAIQRKPESASSNWKQRFDELHGWIEGELNA